MTMLVRTITLIGVVVPGIISLAGHSLPAVTPTEQHPARVVMPPEPPVRATPKADRLSLFDDRWDKMPTVAEIRVIPLDARPAPPPPPLPVVRAERPSPEHEPDLEPKRRHRHEREHRHGDICERHGLHKVITRGGRSWRCR
jgi:hypothetical protein